MEIRLLPAIKIEFTDLFNIILSCLDKKEINGHLVYKEHTSTLSPFSHIRLFVSLWTIACQASLTMGFSRKEFWNGLPCPSPGHLPDPGDRITFKSPALAGEFFTTSTTWEAHIKSI